MLDNNVHISFHGISFNEYKNKKNIETKPSHAQCISETYLYTHLAGPFQCECHPLPQSTSLCPDLLPIVFHFGIYLFLRITYSTTQTAGQNFWLLALVFFCCCFIVFLRTYLALQREEHNSCFRTFFFILFYKLSHGTYLSMYKHVYVISSPLST